MSTERLSFQGAIAQISQLPRATLEGIVASYAGNALRVVWSRHPYTVSRNGTGAEVAQVLSEQPIPVALKRRKEIVYVKAEGLDGRVQVTKATADGSIKFLLSGEVVDPTERHRTFYYSYTVSY